MARGSFERVRIVGGPDGYNTKVFIGDEDQSRRVHSVELSARASDLNRVVIAYALAVDVDVHALLEEEVRLTGYVNRPDRLVWRFETGGKTVSAALRALADEYEREEETPGG